MRHGPLPVFGQQAAAVPSAIVALACNAERDDPRHLPKGASQAEKVIEGGPELLLKGGSDFGTLLS